MPIIHIAHAFSLRSLTMVLEKIASFLLLSKLAEKALMASNNSVGVSQRNTLPIFDGEGYEHWSIMMRSSFRSHDLSGSRWEKASWTKTKSLG